MATLRLTAPSPEALKTKSHFLKAFETVEKVYGDADKPFVRRLRNAAIAERLFLSVRTVDHHVSAILRKLQAGSRSEAVAEARRLGLLQAG